MKSVSHVWLLVTPWTAAHQAPPSMGFSRQEYWSGVPSPSPKKATRFCQLGKAFLLNGRLLSRAIERKVDKMTLHVVWNSVSWRTLARYEKTRLIDSTAIDWHRLYRRDELVRWHSWPRGSVATELSEDPVVCFPFYITELRFYVESWHSPILRETTRAVSLWHFIQALLFSGRYSQPA